MSIERLSPRLGEAVQRRREQLSREAAQKLVADSQKSDSLVRSSYEQSTSIAEIRAMAAETTRFLKSAGIPLNHTYKKIVGHTPKTLFRAPKPILAEESVWLLRHMTKTTSDSSPGKYQTAPDWEAEIFTALDGGANIHIGFLGNDQQYYKVVPDDALIYGPGACSGYLLPGYREQFMRNYPPLPGSAAVGAWQACFAEGIVNLTAN